MEQIILAIGILFILLGGIFLYKAYIIKVNKNTEIQEGEKKIDEQIQSIKRLSEIEFETEQKIKEQKHLLEQGLIQEKERIEESLALYKQNSSFSTQQYEETLEAAYTQAEQKFDNNMQQLKDEEERVQISLQKLRDDLSAGVQAQLREQEKKDKIDFYRIALAENDISDIIMLADLKKSFHQPTVISKLIWTSYCQKKVTEMCNRVLGTGTVCGIYKITNLNTQQCYIGQSVNISDRWKQHCKCGCDIDASASNKLYQDMIKTGIWNFSFELMEECPRDQLNEKEKFWISMYQSDSYGLNSTKGNK